MGYNKFSFCGKMLLDLRGDTVKADKVLAGYTAHDADGEPIVGALPKLIDLQLLAPIMESGLSLVTYNDMRCIRSTCTAVASSKYGAICEETNAVSVNVPVSDFGNATAADVAAGKTFTSSAGIKVSGTAAGGIDTSDADAAAENIEVGKTAYVNGEKITGTLPNSGGRFGWRAPYLENNMIKMDGTVNVKRIFDVGSVLKASVSASEFGDATAADVVAGKTFTSAAGVKLAGTGTGTGGGSSSGLPSTIVAGDTPVLASWSGKKVDATTATATGASITISKAGTYRFRIPACASGSYGSGSPTVYLYKNGAQLQSATVSTSTVTCVSFDVECAAGDVFEVYAAGAGSSYMKIAVVVMGLIACIDWDNGL